MNLERYHHDPTEEATSRRLRSSAETSDASDGSITAWSSTLDIPYDQQSSVSASNACLQSLERLLLAKDYKALATLSVATEASSHPSGLVALKAQPWVYAGGGLGNSDECLSVDQSRSNFTTHNCIAGVAPSRGASLPFASICVPAECNAHDLIGRETLPFLQGTLSISPDTEWLQQSRKLREDYVSLFERIHNINQFLQTGWTCGDFKVPWNTTAVIPYVVALGLLLSLVVTSSRRKKRGHEHIENLVTHPGELGHLLDASTKTAWYDSGHEPLPTPTTVSESSLDNETSKDELTASSDEYKESHWIDAFNVSENMRRLVDVPGSGCTACLDGLRVGSLFWIIMGHVMAIESSTGAGYINPAAFLPPHGWTTTLSGQLLFSSRLAVDTFFVISGFLLVYVLDRKMAWEKRPWSNILTGVIPMTIISRIVRIIPLYAFSLWFYMYLAPHLGGGPFWYQWQGLLMPCQDGRWVWNILFFNNLLDVGVTDTCFYHSWYLAVDLQLYIAAVVMLILLYNFDSCRYHDHRRNLIASLCAMSVVWTGFESWRRKWSINTFDGAAVARYDVEAYANPFIRAQSYFAGMLVASLLNCEDIVPRSLRRRGRWQTPCLIVSLLMMLTVVFVTAAGAYAQRPCQYNQWPGDGVCGSTWSSEMTYIYTAFSRTAWTAGLCAIIYIAVDNALGDEVGNTVNTLSIEQPQSLADVVAFILSWRVWTPLSNLSFGAYLIHPIVIFVWQLGEEQKEVFSLISFSMHNFSIAVASYVAALASALVVEMPIANLWRRFVQRKTG